MSEIQRARLLKATVDAVVEVGYERLTVAQVIARARVSRKTFYDVFRDREECFLAAFDQCVERGARAAGEGHREESGWPDAIRSSLRRVLELMDREPGQARLCVVDSLRAGDRVLMRRREVLREVAAAIERAARGGAREEALGDLASEATVGGVSSILHGRLIEGSSEPLTALLGPLMSVIVLPYLGPDAARHEAGRRPAPRLRAGTRAMFPERADPLDGLRLRLTYRTVRALVAILERPGASNREVAERSGIVDQGQVSKLLSRLSRLDLLENRGDGPERGAANAWHLTPRGEILARAIRSR